jgi:hypothetical protein
MLSILEEAMLEVDFRRVGEGRAVYHFLINSGNCVSGAILWRHPELDGSYKKA